MTNLVDLQSELSKRRKELTQTVLALHKAKAQLAQLNAESLVATKGLSHPERIEKLVLHDNERKKILSNITEFSSDVKKQREDIRNLSKNIFVLLDPEKAVKELSDRYPILMFPLRLETRFKTIDNQNQLWLRVYPDDCNINKLEPLLTDQELKNARSFWIEMWKAGGIEADERGAWRSLVNSHGSGRATWIIKQYQPVNQAPKRAQPSNRVLVVISSQTLQEKEEKAMTKYWSLYWLARGDEKKQKKAFDEFKSALKLNNVAANILKDSYSPINLKDEVPAAITANQVIVSRLELPSTESLITTQSSWNQAPRAMALPDRFFVIAYSGQTKKVLQFQHPVQEDLPVGPDPSLDESEQIRKDDNNDIVLNDELQWMVDFDQAVEVGMATKINLSSKEAIEGFDKLFVIGVRFSSDAQSGAELIEKLFEDHSHTKEGFGLIRQGTPTNNTEEAQSGYSWLENADESYDRVFKNSEDFDEQSEYFQQRDGQILAECLGIDPTILKGVPHANGRDHLEAHAMNTALFPTTLGYFMEEMMDPLFSTRDIDDTKTFFVNFVSGRGPLPAIRIGRQPYGILPISVYSRLAFQLEPSEDLRTRNLGTTGASYRTRLHALIMKMDETWDQLAPQVSHIGQKGDLHQILLDVLSLHANSVEFHQRYAQSVMQIFNQLNLQTSPIVAKIVAEAVINRAKLILQELGLNPNELSLPILEKYFLSKPNLLDGPLIDDVPNSEISPIRAYTNDGKNYIEWLASSTGNRIRLQDFDRNSPPNALLYLLLRHALLQVQAKTATNLLVSHELIENKRLFFDQDFLYVQKEGSGKSKFEHLYQTYPEITGSNTLTLIRYIYSDDFLNGRSEAKVLKETLDALKLLEQTPTARLERLLVEHLDCCSYRIDAWKTGLVQSKLYEQRKSKKQGNAVRGLYLGAYGWLMEVRPKENEAPIKELEPELASIFNPDGTKHIRSDKTNLGYIHAPSIDQAATAAILRNAYDSNKGNQDKNPFEINLTSDRVRIAISFLEGMRNGQSLSALLGYQFERGLHDRSGLAQTEADEFIYPLRRAFPLVAEKLKDTATTEGELSEAKESNNLADDSRVIEALEARNVVDGLKLIQHVHDSPIKTYPFGLPAKLNLPPASDIQLQAIKDEVNRLIYTHDAISDLVMAEQVYQVVKGNFDRAAGVAKSFGKGSYPPEMEFIDTPRSGTSITHRIAIHFDSEADPNTSPNSLQRMTPRAKGEPSINEWLSTILPDPANVQCRVIYSTPLVKDKEIIVSQKHLGLQPIDLLFSLNIDSEQAMAEMDDRIFNYVRYAISKHPYTEISIKYMDEIDATDKSIVSFFELASAIKSLRSILIGAEYVRPDSIGLPEANGTILNTFNEGLLLARVNGLVNNLEQTQNSISALFDTVISIAGLKITLANKLKLHNIDASKLDSILDNLESDIKSYLTDPSNPNKKSILSKFETAISFISDHTIVDSLKTEYGTNIQRYYSDFDAFDQIVEDTCTLFLKSALYDNNQTGTGFIHQRIQTTYSNIFKKLDVVISRWEQKKLDFEVLIATDNPHAAPGIQYTLLQEAERIVSSKLNFPLPSLGQYRKRVKKKKETFDNTLNELRRLKTDKKNKLILFFTEAEAIIQNVAKHDVVAFDIENNRFDLYQEKLQVSLLKEDIASSLKLESNYLTQKTEGCRRLIQDSTLLDSNHEKTQVLLNAAREILGQEAVLLPQFSFTTSDATEVENAYQSSDALMDFVRTNEGRDFPVDDWFYGVARVRKKVHDFETVTCLTTGFRPDKFLFLKPLQFPFIQGDRWLAMKFKDENNAADTFSIKGDKLLYTAHFAKEFDKNKPVCGIIFDSWTELIPSKTQTSGIVFHYDQPNSEPPQTMLLIVSPTTAGQWDWDDIVQSLEETLNMAQKRAVEPSMLSTTDYAQFLPATMMAVTSHLITVATNLSLNNARPQ